MRRVRLVRPEPRMVARARQASLVWVSRETQVPRVRQDPRAKQDARDRLAARPVRQVPRVPLALPRAKLDRPDPGVPQTEIRALRALQESLGSVLLVPRAQESPGRQARRDARVTPEPRQVPRVKLAPLAVPLEKLVPQERWVRLALPRALRATLVRPVLG